MSPASIVSQKPKPSAPADSSTSREATSPQAEDDHHPAEHESEHEKKSFGKKVAQGSLVVHAHHASHGVPFNQFRLPRSTSYADIRSSYAACFAPWSYATRITIMAHRAGVFGVTIFAVHASAARKSSTVSCNAEFRYLVRITHVRPPSANNPEDNRRGQSRPSAVP